MKIVVPKFVKRVGYPKTVDDYLPEVREKFGEMLDSIYKELRITPVKDLRIDKGGKTQARIEHQLAYEMARKNRFGGRERSIHWEEFPELEGAEGLVDEIETKMTGTYYPPSGGYDSWSGEYDYEPGGLADQKTHRIATIYIPSLGARSITIVEAGAYNKKIPVYHLKKVTNDGK